MPRYLIVASLITVVAALGILGVKAMKGEQMGKTIKIYNAETGQVEDVKPIVKTDAEWKAQLTPEQYEITRLKGTEAPFSNTCAIPPAGGSGIYKCVCCGTDLFKYDSKFESGTGWPSFWTPIRT